MNKKKISKKLRKFVKRKMIEAMGGKCQCCGYDRCTNALVFHHLKGNTKKFQLSRITRAEKWPEIVEELRKCILVCCNCHSEIHAGMREIPENYRKFDENYANWNEVKNSVFEEKKFE
jgi:predicted HNH restriction endonuclease